MSRKLTLLLIMLSLMCCCVEGSAPRSLNFAFTPPILSRNTLTFRGGLLGSGLISLAPMRANILRQGASHMMAENKFELEGKIKVIMDIMKFDSGFSKREFVVTTGDMYPQDVKLEVFKEKCSILDQFQVGEDVKVSFNLRGSQWEGKYYVNLQAWRIERLMNGMNVMQNWNIPQPLSAPPQQAGPIKPLVNAMPNWNVPPAPPQPPQTATVMQTMPMPSWNGSQQSANAASSLSWDEDLPF